MQFIDLQAQRRRIEPEINGAVQRVIESGKYVLGPEVGELEKQLAAWCGAKHSVSCANGTDALALALISGLGVTGGTSNLGGGFEPSYSDGKEIGAGGVAPEFGDTTSSIRGDGTSDVVRYGNLSLEVTDADDALARVTTIVESAGGYISASSRSSTGVSW